MSTETLTVNLSIRSDQCYHTTEQHFHIPPDDGLLSSVLFMEIVGQVQQLISTLTPSHVMPAESKATPTQ